MVEYTGLHIPEYMHILYMYCLSLDTLSTRDSIISRTIMYMYIIVSTRDSIISRTIMYIIVSTCDSVISSTIHVHVCTSLLAHVIAQNTGMLIQIYRVIYMYIHVPVLNL